MGPQSCQIVTPSARNLRVGSKQEMNKDPPGRLLSISIPTFNRWSYLSELLSNLVEQATKVDPNGDKIEIVVNDNASTDATGSRILEIRDRRLRYFNNGTNIGGDANFVECVRRAAAKYVWIFGDDEIIADDGIQQVVDVLEALSPSLVITTSSLRQSSYYQDYRHLLLDVSGADPLFPVHHTLITANIFARTLFGVETALQKRSTNYGHMYALLRGLRSGGSVYCFGNAKPVIAVRQTRAPFALEPLNLKRKLIEYQSAVARTFGVPYLALYVRLFYYLLNLESFKKIKAILNFPCAVIRKVLAKANKLMRSRIVILKNLIATRTRS